MSEQTVKAIIENSAGYLWFIFLALWGGTASYFSRLKKTGTGFSFAELIGEWFISGFAGIVTAYMCQSMHLDFYMTAAAAGVAGHMGGRGIFMIESYFNNKFNKTFGKNQDTKNEND